MKRKTKKKLKHLVTKKKILKKRYSQRLLRSFFVLIVAASTGSLALAIANNKPKVALEVNVHTHATTLQAAAPAAPPIDQIGTASWYALGLPAPDALTCASTRFGRGSYLEVRNRRNGRVVTCLVNDYGPEIWTGRVIDLSRGSFRVID